MATKKHNLSQFDSPLPSAAEMRFGIVVAEWNREVTEALLEGAVRTLRAAGCPDLNIQIKYVPGWQRRWRWYRPPKAGPAGPEAHAFPSKP
jgi:6,7-dimethyl-8-ribityllumazine synthase